MSKHRPAKNTIIKAQKKLIEKIFKKSGISQASKYCWACKVLSKKLIKCHILPYRLSKDNNPENFMLLCKDCHYYQPDVSDIRIQYSWLLDSSHLKRRYLEAQKFIDPFLKLSEDLLNTVIIGKDIEIWLKEGLDSASSNQKNAKSNSIWNCYRQITKISEINENVDILKLFNRKLSELSGIFLDIPSLNLPPNGYSYICLCIMELYQYSDHINKNSKNAGTTSLGYKRRYISRSKSVLEIDNTELDVVRKIIKFREENWTLQAISDYLNKNKTPPKRGRKWHPSSVSYILNNSKAKDIIINETQNLKR